MRLAMYVHKRQHGVTVVVRRKVQVQADPRPARRNGRSSQWKIPRVVVLPEKRQREVRQNAGAMAANRAIIQGSSFDTGGRHFLFDRREVPPDLVLQKDDWIVFNNRHYDIESIDGLRVRHGLAGDCQGTARARRSLRHADDPVSPTADQLALQDSSRHEPIGARMAVNPNWARWAFASVATLLKQLADDAGIPALVEGLDERTTAYMEAPQRVEIRMSGPFTKELSKDYYELGVDINLLFTSRYEINANQYDIIKIVGKFHEALDGPIPMLRLGRRAGR